MSFTYRHIVRSLMLIILFGAVALPLRAQDGETSLVSQALLSARAACLNVPSGSACIGSEPATAASLDGDLTEFTGVGTLTKLDGLRTLTTARADDQWGVVVARLQADVPVAGGGATTLILLGDTQVTNTFDPNNIAPICVASNLNVGQVNIHEEPNANTPVLRQLEAQGKLPANGRTEAGDWFRVEFNGDLGWIRNQNLGLDCEPNSLAVVGLDDVSALYQSALQQMIVESAPSRGEAINGLLIQAPLTETALLLVNGARIRLSGAAFITANATEMTITGLSGEVEVRFRRDVVNLRQGEATVIALAEGLATAAPASPAPAEMGNLMDVLNSVIYGQPYAGIGSTINGFGVNSGIQVAGDDQLVRLNLSYTGDAGVCDVIDTPSIDVVLAVNITDAMTEDALAVTRAAIARFIQQLDLSSDRYSVVVFRSQAITVTPLTDQYDDTRWQADFDEAVTRIIREDAATSSALNVGLATALSVLKGGANENDVVIFITDDSAAVSEAAVNIAGEIKNRGIRLVGLGLGDNASGALGRITDEVRFSETALELVWALDDLGASLVGQIAVTDLNIVYRLDTERYEALEPLLDFVGWQETGDGEYTFSAAAVYDGQTIEAPLVVRVIEAGDGPVGEATLSYALCGESVQSPNPVAGPVVLNDERGDDREITLANGVIRFGDVGRANIKAFNEQTWVLNLEEEGLIAVTTTDQPAGFTAFLSGSTLTPVYTLANFDGAGSSRYIFNVPAGPRWLVLQSTDARTASQYTVSVSTDLGEGDLLSIVPNGDRVNDTQRDFEGRVYKLEATEGDLLTVRYAGEVDTSPFEIVSSDGQTALEVYSRFDPALTQWVSLQVVRGSAPYRMVVKTEGDYGLEVDLGDTFTDSEGALNVGANITKTVLGDQTVVVTYDLTLSQPQQINITASGNTSVTALRDANNQIVNAIERVNVNRFNIGRYDLAAGTYKLYLEVTGNYGLNVTVANGTLAETLSQLKGTLLIGQTLQDSVRGDTPFAVYNISEGLGAKPLRENDLVTIFMENVARTGPQTVSVRSADGLVSQITLSFTQVRDNRYISVHRIQGQPPYQVFVIGQNNFRAIAQRGDLLANNKGVLILGQPARDSSNAPQFLYYTLAPELGKRLVEGDIVTISYVNRGTTNRQAPLTAEDRQDPVLADAKEQAIAPIEFYETDDVFIGVYELRGQPPYRLTIQNLGAYEMQARIGNNLVVDRGQIEIGETANGTTAGIQIIEYEVLGELGTPFTLSVTDTTNRIQSGADLNVQLVNAEGDDLSSSFELSGTNNYKRVYQLEGQGPYRLSFTQNGTYEVKLTEGDELTSDKGTWFLGDAEIINLQDEDRGKILVYNLENPTPQAMSIQMRSAFPIVIDPDGDFVDEALGLFAYDRGRFNGRIGVYNFDKVGTYQLVVIPFGNYTLRVTPGEIITVPKGNAFFGATETDKLADDKRFASYVINGEAGEQITVRLDQQRFAQRRSFLSRNVLTLVNADNNVISTQWEVFDDGYLLFVYELSGPGPYTLFVQPQRFGANFENNNGVAQEEYRLTIVEGDQARYDMGRINVEETIEDELLREEGRRTLNYTLENSEVGREITIELTPTTTRRQFEAASLALYDPDGELVPESIFRFVSNQTGRYSFRLDKVGTYRIQFNMKEKYKLQIIRGDIQKAEFGRVPINPDNPPQVQRVNAQGELEFDNDGNPVFEEFEPLIVENRLERNQEVAVYDLEGLKRGDIISVVISGRLDSDIVQLLDANEVPAPLSVAFPDRNTNTYVFEIVRDGTHKLRFEPSSGNHSVRVDYGIVLIQEFGALPVNPADPPVVFDDRGREEPFEPEVAEPDIERPAVAALYDIPLPQGNIISLQVDQRGNTTLTPLVLNGDGDALAPIDSVPNRGSLLETYELTGSPPYQVLVVSLNDFSVTLTEGDILTEDMGPIPLNIADPFVAELPPPSRIAKHTLDVEPGQLLTLQIKNQRRVIFEALRDANGNLITAEILDFQGNDNNVSVYLLSGVGPYELSFAAFGEYEVLANSGNKIRVDLGLVTFEAEIEGELEQPARVATYAIDGKRDQFITVQLQVNNRPAIGELRDANGKLWEIQKILTQNNRSYLVYELGGPPPYTITFDSTGGYTITVNDGDLLRANLGGAPFEQEIRGQLETPQRVAVYQILASPGETITVALQDGSRPGTPVLVNGDGQTLPVETRIDKRNTAYVVYTLSGAEPYTLEFESSGRYTLTVSRGNILRTKLPDPLPFGEQVREQLDFPSEIAIYQLENIVQEGDVISIALQDGSRAVENGTLRNANGEEIKPAASVSKRNFNYKVYTLVGPGPYELTFPTQGRYTVQATRGNVLRADKGPIRFGNTATDQLAQPQEAAIYIVDAVEGQVISIRLSDRNRPLEQAVLRDADGNEILPFAKANVSGSAYSVFRLTGAPPYTFTFIPQGRYSLTLTDGNIFRGELGTIAFGDSVRNRLVLPTRTAAYTINTESNQVISVKLDNTGREFIIPRLINSEVTTLTPLAEVFNNNNGYIGVYLLEGAAPFTLEFEALPTVTYTLGLERGNVTEVELPEIGPLAPVEGPGSRTGGRGAAGASR